MLFRSKGLLEQVGGLAYLAGLPEAVPSAANLSYYSDIVSEKATLRRMIRVCTDTVGKVYEFEGEVSQLVEEFEAEALKVSGAAGTQETHRPLVEVVRESLHKLEMQMGRNGQVSGLTTGIADLDVMVDGMHPKEYFVIAARPSMGKTALAMNIAEHVAVDLKVPVGVFSVEMADSSLTTRMMFTQIGRAHV